MMGQYRELEELRKSFLCAYEEEKWEMALTIQMEILHICQEDETNNTEEVAREMHNLGVVLDEMEQFEKAELCYDRSANAKRMCNGATMSLADTLNNLGIVRHKLEKHKEGLDAHEEVLAIQNRFLEKNDRERIQTLWHLGYGYEAFGSHEKAISALEEVLQWAGRETEYTKLELAQIYGEIALCYEKVGNYKKGIYSYERALHWLEKEKETESFSYLQYLWKLSALCNAAEYGDLAVEYGEKALVLEDKKYKIEDISKLQSINRLANICKGNGEYETSVQLHQRALELIAKMMGIHHMLYREISISLAMVYMEWATASGDVEVFQKSKDILENVLQKNRNLPQADAVQVLASTGLLAVIAHKMGDGQEGIAYFESALVKDFWEMDLGENGVLDALFLLARLLYEVNLFEPAMHCAGKILSHTKKHSIHHLHGLYLLGRIMEKRDHVEESAIVYQMAQEIAEEMYPENHPDIASGWKRLGVAYQKGGDFAKAKECYEKALEMETLMLDEDNPNRLRTLRHLASVCFWRGEYGDNIAYLKELNDLNFEETKEELENASIVLLAMGAGYLAMGDVEKGKAYGEEARGKQERSRMPKSPKYLQQERIYEKLKSGESVYYMEETQKEMDFTEQKSICQSLQKMVADIAEQSVRNEERDTLLFSSIGGLYADFGEYEKALEWYRKGEKTAEDDRYLHCCICVGRMYLHLGEWEKALRQFVNAKEYTLEYKEMEAVPLCLLSGWIGDAYRGMGEGELALQAYIGWERKCRNLSMPRGGQYGERVLYGAELLDEMGNTGLAVGWYEKYRDVLSGGFPKDERYAKVQLKLVELLLYKERAETCLGMLDEILAMGQERKVQQQIAFSAEIFDKLGQLYFMLEEEEKAWESLVLAYEGSKILKQSMSKEGLWIFFRLLQEKE